MLAQQQAQGLTAAGWQVGVESEDGSRAYQRIEAHPPDVVVIDLSLKPSHGRRTAAALREHKATRDLPIVFVDGTARAIETATAQVPDAIFTTCARLQSTLRLGITAPQSLASLHRARLSPPRICGTMVHSRRQEAVCLPTRQLSASDQRELVTKQPP